MGIVFEESLISETGLSMSRFMVSSQLILSALDVLFLKLDDFQQSIRGLPRMK
jgi:hypothetical protein